MPKGSKKMNKDNCKAANTSMHKAECKLLAEIFSENFPQHFESGFVHLSSNASGCSESIVSAVIQKAVDFHCFAAEIVNGCKIVSDTFIQYTKQTGEANNPLIHCIQTSARSLFESIKNDNCGNTKCANNAVMVLGLLYNTDFLTDSIMKKCLSTFLTLAESKSQFLRHFCKLLLQIKEKLSETNSGASLLATSTSRLQTFVKKMDSPEDSLPLYVQKCLATPTNEEKEIANDLTPPPSSLAAAEKAVEIREDESTLPIALKNAIMDKFDSFLGCLMMFKNQVNGSLHNEKFYSIMAKGLMEWQAFCITEDDIDICELTNFCESEINLLRSNVDLFRRGYTLTIIESNEQVVISQCDLNVLKSSQQLRERVLNAAKFIATLYNTHKLNEMFVVNILHFMLSFEAVSNFSLECAINLLFVIMPKFIVSEHGPQIVKYMVHNIQKVVIEAKCNARVKFLLIDLMHNINRFFPFMHVDCVFDFKHKLTKFPLTVTFNTSTPVW